MTGKHTPPSIYTVSQVVRPVSRPPDFREFGAATVAHELWGHAFAGFDHEGGDLMDNSAPGGLARQKFNPQHTQYLRDLMRLTPQNYLTPRNGIIPNPNSMGILSEGVFNSQQRSFSVAVSVPLGTKQLYSEIRLLDSDGQVILEYVNDPGLIHAWSEIGKKIPESSLSAGQVYSWKICSSGLSLPLSAQGPNQDPRWREVEAYPGLFFPNPCAELKFKIPPYRVLLPVVGK